MEIIFLGHQGWLLGSKETYIIVDPILTETFGTSPELQFRVYPPRQVDVNKMPPLKGIFITNEHLDHFHLPSIKLLDKSIPVFMGKAMPDCVKNTVKKLGFNLFDMNNTEFVQLNDLKIRFYIGKNTVPFWEKRCYQLFITDQYNTGVFIQSDTLVDDFIISQVEKKMEPSPTVFITTNNAQTLPSSLYGAFDNLLPLSYF